MKNNKTVTLKELMEGLNSMIIDFPEMLDCGVFVNIDIERENGEMDFYQLTGLTKFTTKTKNQINFSGVGLLGNGDKLVLCSKGGYSQESLDKEKTI